MPVVTTSREHPSQVRRWWTSPRSWRTSSLLWSGSWTTTIRTMLEFGYVTNPGLRHTHIVDFNLFMCGTLDNSIAFMCGLAAFTGTGRIQNSVIWMSCPKSLLRLAVLAIPMPSQRRLQPSWPNPKVERRRRRALHMEHVHTCDSLLPKTCTKNPHSTHTHTHTGQVWVPGNGNSVSVSPQVWTNCSYSFNRRSNPRTSQMPSAGRHRRCSSVVLKLVLSDGMGSGGTWSHKVRYVCLGWMA